MRAVFLTSLDKEEDNKYKQRNFAGFHLRLCNIWKEEIMEIRFEERKQLKEKPDQKHLGFGKYMTDYMFIMDWDKDQGWHDARIVPQGPIELGSGMCDTALCTGDI